MPLCVKNILDLIEDKKQENISEKKKKRKYFGSTKSGQVSCGVLDSLKQRFSHWRKDIT